MGIFELPPEEERIKSIRFIKFKKENLSHPDLYIFTRYGINALRVNFALFISCILLTILSDMNGYFEELSTYKIFLHWIDQFAPLTIFLIIFYIVLYWKNVDRNRYDILKIRNGTQKNPNAFYVVCMTPLFLSILLSPSRSLLGMFNTSRMETLPQYFDYYSFTIAMGTFWVFSYSSVGLLLLASCLMAARIYEIRKEKYRNS